MPPIILAREEAITVEHPLVLHGRLRVDHDIVTRLQCGTGAWGGDARLALYADPRENTWELWRLEYDGKYRIAGRQKRPGLGQTGQTLGEDLLNTLLHHLVSVDLQRGHDPIADLDAHEAGLERRHEAEFSDFVTNDFADRLKHALKKDGALDHCTGL